jgi:O-antigen/teichoic acid export membrane protein
VTSILFILAARWRPSFEFSTRAFRSMSTFALPLTAGSVLFAVQSILTVLLVGHFLGVAELGIWNFAMAIVILPATLLAAPISRVIYAAFARMREDQERVAEVWVTGFTLLAGVVLPALFGLIAVAPDVIPLAFGSQWTPAVAVVQILAVFVMSRALQTWNTSVMDAAGRPHVAMVLNGLVLVALPPCIWFGSSYGIEGVAVGFAAASLVFGEFPSFYLTTRQLSLRPLNVLGRLRGIGLACAVLCVGVILIRHALEQAGIGAEPRLGLSILLGAAIYTICLWLFAPRVARDLLRMAKRLGRSRT